MIRWTRVACGRWKRVAAIACSLFCAVSLLDIEVGVEITGDYELVLNVEKGFDFFCISVAIRNIN